MTHHVSCPTSHYTHQSVTASQSAVSKYQKSSRVDDETQFHSRKDLFHGIIANVLDSMNQECIAELFAAPLILIISLARVTSAHPNPNSCNLLQTAPPQPSTSGEGNGNWSNRYCLRSKPAKTTNHHVTSHQSLQNN